jgi:DnaJ-domain-containing protein 1
VPDHFATLGVDRAPWLDPDILKQSFLAQSAELHPDKATSEKTQAEAQFRALNESYNILRNNRSRILHLLELEGVSKPGHVEAIPPAALEFFSSIAEITRRSDALLKEKAAADSPMLKVQFFAKAVDCVDALQVLQQKILSRIAEVETELQQLNSSWNAHEESALDQLQRAAAALGFLERWSAQLQERAAALTF